MFNSNDLIKEIPASLLHTAKIYIRSNAVEQTTYNAIQYPLVTVKGRTSLPFSGVTYHSTVRISEKTGRILSCSCTCAAGSGGRICVHEAAVLSCYVSARETGRITFEYDNEKERSSRQVLQFLNASEDTGIRSTSSAVSLRAYVSLSDSDISDHAMTVQFKIGSPKGRFYVLKSIATLLERERFGREMDVSSSFSFIPCEAAFTPACRSMYRFFKSIASGNDTYSGSRYNSYLYEPSAPDRYLTLKGRYLDDFIEACSDGSLFAENCGPSPVLLSVSDEMPSFHAVLEKSKKGGFSFSADRPVYFTGEKYLYFADHACGKLYRIRSDLDHKVIRFLDFCEQSRGKQLTVAPSDMRPFVRNILPGVSSIYDLETRDLSLAEYLPPKPAFVFYLDLPQPDLLTCETRAIYPGGTFNIFDSVKKNSSVRNAEEEQAVEKTISPLFNTFDPTARKMAIADDENMLAEFLSSGVSMMQTIGEVFISESLKKLQIRPVPTVSIGVSLSGNLLDFSMSADQRSLDDLAEILSRYRPKKKYYRLKNGSFIKVSDDAQLSVLEQLTKDLQLSEKEIRNGSASMPAFRAMYIEQTAGGSSSLSITRDAGFRDLIRKLSNQEDSFKTPDSLNAELRDYQKEGLSWLRRLYECKFGALLADDMGLGKTLQVIALLASLNSRGQCLVVCPASLVYNWRNEIRRFCPEIPAVMISGTAAARKSLIETAPSDAVLITSYDTLRRDTDLYKDRSFTVEIIDEAQYIKNAATKAASAVKTIHADFRIALTGTPIENRLSELWSIFDYLLPGYLLSYERFRKTFEIPILTGQDPDCAERFRRLISPFILRRRKTDVLKELPEKIERVYYAPFKDEQKELYDARRQRLKLMLEGKSGEDLRKERIAILAELTRLRQICCAPSLIYDDYRGNSEKEELCLQLIRTAVEGGHKILLFSQFKTMLERLNARLEKEDIPYYFLSGETPKEKRAEMVEAFQQDDTSVFSISLKAGGTGLNLTAADIVIHYDPWWNVAAENQASDRTHRIGQTNPVTVYKLIVEDTIEEKIIDLQNQKSALADEILAADEMSSSSFKLDELLKII